MRIIIFLFLVSFGLFGCIDKKPMVCNCCELPYGDVKTAMDCIDESPIIGTSSDERMLLLAFTKKELDTNKQLTWNIISDPEIVKVAKRNNLLVILNVDDFSETIKDNNELLGVINSHKNESQFFVLVNQAYYPFGDWKNDANKNMIIGVLEVGNGP